MWVTAGRDPSLHMTDPSLGWPMPIPRRSSVRCAAMSGVRGPRFAARERYEREARYPTELVVKLGPPGLLGFLDRWRYGGSFSDV